MSSGGATLQGSFSGETGTITEVGFYYGTTSNPSTKVTATGTSSPFTKALTGLTQNTTYYYKAYVIEGGEERTGSVQSFTTKAVATATVTTNAASGVSSSQATLNASFSGATGTIYDRGFRYKKGNGSWITPSGLGSTSGTSGNFSMVISSLEASTTYSFQAYVTEWDEAQNQYVDRWASNTLSFTTAAQQTTPSTTGGWLELPEVTGNEDFVGKFYGSGSTAGTNRNYSYSYNYSYYASMWVAYPLTAAHTSGSGGTSSWRYNPNIANNKQINIVSNAYGTMYGASQYARGHQIPNASRKSDDTMNLQTYYSTNQTPQLQNKFNGSIWSSLEGAVRNLTSSVDTVYVVTGPLYRKVGGSETINYLTGASSSANPASLPIPNYYWKALLKVKRDGNGNVTAASTIGFFFEHKEYSDSAYANYVVSVNQIETWTGLNLFHNLPDSIEETAESNTSWSSFQSYSNINSVSGNNWGAF